jgi:site-specific DNA-cytosine methylase
VTYIPTLNEFLQLQQGWQQPHHHQSLQQQSGRQQELDHLERPKQRQVDTQQDQQQEQQQWQQQQGEQQQLPLESSHLTGLQACLHKGLAAHNSLVQIHQEVPDEVLEKHAEVLDVVSTSSRSCNCFTKGYGKLMRGAGSLLATVDPAQVDPRWLLAAGGSGSLVYQGYGTDGGMDSPVCTNQAHVPATCSCHPLKVTDQQTLSEAWKQLRPRFFTPEEIAMLHSFPETFTFPSSMSSRQCYKLLGNSLSVAVVADLLRYLLGPAICCQT